MSIQRDRNDHAKEHNTYLEFDVTINTINIISDLPETGASRYAASERGLYVAKPI